MALTIKVPQGYIVNDEIWELFKVDLKDDNEFRKLCKRFYIAEDEKNWRKMKEIERQINVRVEQYYAYWLKKYGSASLSLKEVMAILHGKNKVRFKLLIAVTLFLADFMEDCFAKMNDIIRKELPDASYNPLEDFFKLKKKVATFSKEILDEEDDGFREIFREHAAGIKMTIYNKVNGFLNKIPEEDERQLSFEFEDNDCGSTAGNYSHNDDDKPLINKQ